MRLLNELSKSSFLLIVIGMMILTQSCGELTNSEVTTNLNLKVEVTDDFEGGVAQSLPKSSVLQKVNGDNGLELNERVSFTPTSMKIYIKSADLFTDYESEAGNHIFIPLDQEIELIGQKALVDLIYQNVEVDSAEFDDYIGIQLELRDTVKVSGTVTVRNRDYTFRDLKISLGFSGVGGCIPDTIHIDGEVDETVTALLDVENSFVIEKAADGDIGVHIADSIGVNIQNAVLLPYAGNKKPTVEKYIVTWDAAADHNHFLEVIALTNGYGKLSNIGIRNVFQEGFTRYQNAFQPASWLDVRFIEIEPGVYQIYDSDDQSGAPMITFPAFELDSHEGTFDYVDPFSDVPGQQRMPYTAVKVE